MQADTETPRSTQAPSGKGRLKKTPAALKAHPDYVAFSNLMHGGVYYNRRELHEIFSSETFKRFAALFPRANTSGDQGPDPSGVTQTGTENSLVEATDRPTKP